jgi:hypothetical protein
LSFLSFLSYKRILILESIKKILQKSHKGEGQGVMVRDCDGVRDSIGARVRARARVRDRVRYRVRDRVRYRVRDRDRDRYRERERDRARAGFRIKVGSGIGKKYKKDKFCK